MALAEEKNAASEKRGVSVPSISLPKGGGAIHGMGEKFSANPVTGTGAMTVPIAISPGRAGFGPNLSLSYDSGTGNGIFGLGWNLGHASISRKTDKGLPRYVESEPDVFLLSGAEDLVPLISSSSDEIKSQELIKFQNKEYQVYRYRPRIEGGFALIERWLNKADSADCIWRTISKDNITSWFGRSEQSRIFNPTNHSQIFQWLLDETHDDKGNVIRYEYIAEDSENIEINACENNRTQADRTANRYLKRIQYGNTVSYLDQAKWPTNEWMFEVVFDFGEAPNHKWPMRDDPFSNYRAGFEIRTYRLCHRVLMFHHFTELGNEAYLVKSTNFLYQFAETRNPEQPGYTQLKSVTHHSYEVDNSTLHSRQLPQLTLKYTQPKINSTFQFVDASQLENLPVGTQGSGYQWVDLNGEGLSGVLTEQAGAWYYKPNYGESEGVPSFGPTTVIASQPSFAALSSGRQQLMDLAGNGEIDLVDFSGNNPGFYERTYDDNWKSFVPFIALPNIDWNDQNLRFLDLTGDGHADALITEQDVFTWYQSLDEHGFDSSQQVKQAKDEDDGPTLVFADLTQSIFLADMCGDGLTDIVRIRNGEVCYWPNIGYGHFGKKVTLDNSPLFDHSDMYDPHRIRLADIDGSGPIDIIYLGGDGANLYFNRSGNSLSNAFLINIPVATENIGAVQVADLFGSGTACLVWNSHLPADAAHPVRYINLMAEGKPHLLKETDNNLGAITTIEYTPSTKFYIQDKLAGTPWITKLPFPVHCVSKVIVKDYWRGTEFGSQYSYHHGYFDGAEREFRGFGRVEQVDVEDYGEFLKGNIASPYITNDQKLFQPPIKSVTWYHTGAAIDRKRILDQFAAEYFPEKYKNQLNQSVFKERKLCEPELPPDLTAEEWREALRACKGMVLRQESYELDVDDLGRKVEKPVRIYSATTHNCNIQRIQKRGENKHAVFLVTESEALSYYYELELPKLPNTKVTPDPRISHTFNLRHDNHGNPQQSLAVTYGRVILGQHTGLPNNIGSAIKSFIDDVQEPAHIVYSEIHYTQDVILKDQGQGAPIKHYRLRLPYEVKTYEITGLPAPTSVYFDINELRKYVLSDFAAYQLTIPVSDQITLTPLQYHEQAQTNTPHQRLVEHACTRFFNDGDGASGVPITPANVLPLGQHGPRGLKYEDYKLALTSELLDAVFQQRDATGNLLDDKLAWQIDDVTSQTVKQYFDTLSGTDLHYLKCGYIKGAGIDASFADQYWMRSGTAGFASDANEHFYLPEVYTDPFGNQTTLQYDPLDLYVLSSADALGNASSIAQFDYRVLAPGEMVDANGNHTEVVFDILGLPIAAAIKGKRINNKWEGDDLTGFDFSLRNPSTQAIQAFCMATEMNETTARDWLGSATTRFVYHFGDVNGQWKQRMAGACSIAREQHKAANSPLQVSLECSDGSGNVLMKKVQAEPKAGETKLQWIINGLTILNNKGKPVKQYEPYFSEKGFGCEMPSEKGVTPIIYYDAAGRTIRTEMPDGTFSRVEFSPWHVNIFDANDTVLESDWYQRRTNSQHPRYAEFNTPENSRAARLAANHANTPAITILDSLGRDVIAIAHNRAPNANGTWQDEYHTTYSKLDAEGKPLWIRDALGHLVMQYINPPRANNAADEALPANAAPCYDIAGNLLFQHSMDAGGKWTINDAAGKPMFAWDTYKASATAPEEKRLYSTEYDALHRPTALKLKINNAPAQIIEKFVYQDARPSLTNKNLNGQMTHHYDASGMVETVLLDFKGSPLQVNRRLVKDAKSTVTSWQGNLNTKLETETFSQRTEYDALGRMTRLYNWHRGVGSRVSVYVPKYSARGNLKAEQLIVGATKTAQGYSGGTATRAIQDISYDAKGQRQYLKLGNGTITRYDYDVETYRLKQLRTTRPVYDPEFPKYRADLKDAKVLQQLSYTYDPVGNIAEIYDEAYKPAYFQNAIIAPQSLYEYDALYRLIQATGREDGVAIGAPKQIESAPHEHSFPVTAANALRQYTQSYQYDAVGNILVMVHAAGLNNAGGWTRKYQYAFDDPQQPASNRLWRTWQGSGDFNSTNANNRVTYAYDSHGSMLNLANTPDEFKMRWDHQDMISSINLGNGFAHYQYDVGKQRTRKYITKNNGNIIEERIYLGGLELYRRKENGVLKEEIETLHLFDGEQRLLMVDQVLKTNNAKLTVGNLYRYTLSNHLGSSNIELDDHAEVISFEEYHPYGTSAYRGGRNIEEVKLKRYRYTGMERDEESGLSYHTARYLAQGICCWLSADPIGINGGENMYRYVDNNPIKFVDMTGKQADAGSKEAQWKRDSDNTARNKEIAWVYSPNVRKEYYESEGACISVQPKCEKELPDAGMIDKVIKKSRVKMKEYSKSAQENMEYWLSGTGEEKILDSSLFEKRKEVKDAEPKLREQYVEEIRKRLEQGTLKVEKGLPLEIPIHKFQGVEVASNDDKKDDLAYTTGHFTLGGFTTVRVSQLESGDFQLEFIEWKEQAVDLYNWDVGKFSVVQEFKKAAGLPSDQQMCCVENAGKAKFFLMRTELWYVKDKALLKSEVLK
ncbi:MAG: SpvB/TcaC N-terminal domain-containing protein [Methylotenera sp.]